MGKLKKACMKVIPRLLRDRLEDLDIRRRHKDDDEYSTNVVSDELLNTGTLLEGETARIHRDSIMEERRDSQSKSSDYYLTK